jgi:hypothetical protein
MTKSNSWRGHDWSSDLPLWDKSHPLFKEVGPAKREQRVTNEHATTEIVVPDLDPELCEVIASFAACFTAPFYKAQRIAPVVALERVARLYWELGNDPQKWLDYLAQIGVKVAPQSRSEFIAFLRFICGNALDRSRHLGKMAWCLTEWVEIFDAEKDYIPPPQSSPPTRHRTPPREPRSAMPLSMGAGRENANEINGFGETRESCGINGLGAWHGRNAGSKGTGNEGCVAAFTVKLTARI